MRLGDHFILIDDITGKRIDLPRLENRMVVCANCGIDFPNCYTTKRKFCAVCRYQDRNNKAKKFYKNKKRPKKSSR